MAFSDLWDDFAASVREGLETLARNTVGGLFDEARADAEAFLQGSRAALERWADALANGIITREDFEALVAAEQGLAKLHALQAVGVGRARLERFRSGLGSLVVKSAFAAIGI